MTNATSQITFTKIVNLNKGDKDIKRLIRTLIEHGVGKDTHRLIPIFTEVKFQTRLSDYSAIGARRFLQALRPFQLSHHMRFISDLDTLIEADCGDVFYAKGNRDEGHKDATFLVHVISAVHIEVKVKIHPITRTHLNIRELSRMAYPILFGLKASTDEDAASLEMIKFHRNNKLSELTETCKEPINILFIPSKSSGGCYTIPLFGLSQADAIRRSTYTDEAFSSCYGRYGNYISEIVFSQQLAEMLVDEITVNEKSGPRSVVTAQTYFLAEILFGYYLRTRLCNKDASPIKSNFVWFETVKHFGESFVETYAVHVRHD
jgi:hypothetical protein